jgi:hypothetical protein
MTDRPTKIIINCSTGEREIIELTDAEIAEREAMAAQAAEEQAAREATEAARLEAKASAESKLAALGLTAEEIAALTA